MCLSSDVSVLITAAIIAVIINLRKPASKYMYVRGCVVTSDCRRLCGVTLEQPTNEWQLDGKLVMRDVRVTYQWVAARRQAWEARC